MRLPPLYSGIILTLFKTLTQLFASVIAKEWQGFDGCGTLGQRLRPPSLPIPSLNFVNATY
jgi:hypothetical protein